MSVSNRLLVAMLLALIGAVLSGLLLLQHHGEALGTSAVSEVCGEGDQSGCEAVARSRYSEVAGLPLAALGVFFYVSVALGLVLALQAPAEFRDGSAFSALVAFGVALAIDLALLAIQAFSIRAYCKLCLLTYAVNAAAFALLLPAHRARAAARAACARPEARLLLSGWVLTSFALAASVVAAEAALSYREKERAASLLGLPAAGMRSSPASAQDYAEQARLAQQEARRLQGILDDPKKLDAYFAAKAAQEFENATPQPLKLEGVPFKGPAQAPIKVVEYSDFLCPYCRSLATAFSSYVPQSGNRVTVYFKNYPLDPACNPHMKSTMHAGACWLALVALCAHEQGRFWEYHDKAFAAELKDPERKDALQLGTQAGLNAAALGSCLDSPRTKERLLEQINEAQAAGLKGTPTVFINGKLLPRINDFIDMVEKEAQRLGLPPLSRPEGR